MEHRVLVVGSGGREHAICKKLVENENIELYCYGTNNNPGIYELTGLGNFRVAKNLDIECIVDYARANQINYVVVGPEKPLADGLADLLAHVNIGCIGPKNRLAQLESSKIFTRRLLESIGLNVYNPDYRIYSNKDGIDQVIDYISSLDHDYVVKADGLCGGKGVKLSGDHLKSINDTVRYVLELSDKGESYLIEEKLYGDEFTVMSFCDGESFLHTPPCQDFKRREPYDLGVQTGGMGSISCANHLLPFLVPHDLDHAHYVIEKTIQELMNKVKINYCGIVYGSFMKTRSGEIKLIEFNVRFGDSECINLLHILQSDLHELFMSMLNKTLSGYTAEFKQVSTVFKYLVPNSYPDKRHIARQVKIGEGANKDLHIYAGIDMIGQSYYTTGSRTMGVICEGKALLDASRLVDEEIYNLDPVLHFRYDIGNKKKGNSSYTEAGVDVDKLDSAVLSIRESVESTHNSNVVSRWGDFAGMYSMEDFKEEEKRLLLVGSTDGVGTKTAFCTSMLGVKGAYTNGMDIVNHCVNDILVKGAKPMFFLNYFASDNVDPEQLKQYIEGIGVACQEVGCAILGGETAEMPNVYNSGHCDMVGSIVGYVFKDQLIDGPKNIKNKDVIYGIPASGPHTNGYSLIRKVVEKSGDRIKKEVLDQLCNPHRCYLHEISRLRENGIDLHGLVHITGGGYFGNVKRVLPSGFTAVFKQWALPEPFNSIQLEGNISTEEMFNTFNCGYGMLLFIPQSEIKEVSKLLNEGTVLGVVYNSTEFNTPVIFT